MLLIRVTQRETRQHFVIPLRESFVRHLLNHGWILSDDDLYEHEKSGACVEFMDELGDHHEFHRFEERLSQDALREKVAV